MSLKRYLLLVFLLCNLVGLVSAQGVFDYGNAWYNPNQQYLKLRVWQEGMYRVTANDLSSAGFNVSSSDLPQLQLLYRGKEQYIHVQTTAGNLDYIDFYGVRNDGKVDSIVYRNPSTISHDPNQQPIERLSLYTDTAAYYLTIGPNPGLRVTTFNDQNFGNYTPEPYFRTEVYHEYHPNNGTPAGWNSGGGATYEIYHGLNSYFITGEGYVGQGFQHGSQFPIPLATPRPANVGTPSEFSCRIFGRSSWQHILTVHIDGNQVIRDTVNGIYLRTRTRQYNQPLGNMTNVVYNALGTENNNTDNNNYCWSSIRYDRLFDLDGADHAKMVDWQKASNAYLRFTTTGFATGDAYAWDITNHVRCVGIGTGGNNMQIVIPGAANKRDLYVTTLAAVRTPLIEQPKLDYLSSPSAGAEFVIITHPSLLPSANAYKNYRDTCTFNQLDAKVVTVDQIYDEFGYGSITPLAIKRFCKFAIDNWQVKPKYFMLWGKGQYETRQRPLNLVPTFSDPACDYEYVSDFDFYQVNVTPEVPIGRVNIFDNQEGQVYLDKVNEYEHRSFEAWMKEVVFLGGGDDTLEQKPILNFFRNSYKPFIESAPLGGNVNYYQKFNTGLITNSPLTSTQRINEGTAIIHFFGHSSSNIYDVDIQEPVLYHNFSKIPLMVAFGCYGGNFTGDAKSFGERFVLEPGRGSIGYLANSTAGYLLPLGNFGDVFYSKLYRDDYGRAIGDVIKSTIDEYHSRWSDMVYVNHAKQMNLQGDPSLVIYSPQLPDLAITEQDVYFTPADFSASDSSFTINVITHNLGKATQDSFYFSIRQLLPSGTWVTYPKVLHPPIANMDTISYEIFNTIGSAMAGLNTFDIFVDSTDVLTEYNENNNRLFFTHVIQGNTPAILYPYDFAIVPDNAVRLSASAIVMGTQTPVRYQYEIDTVPDFNSPMHQVSPVINGNSTYSEWTPPFTLTDSMVYYWRVRLADHYPATWAKASFKYINTRRGWAQSQPPQFYTDPVQQVAMDQVNRQWKFDPYSVELAAYVSDGGHAVYRLANGAFFSILPPVTNLNGIMATPIRHRDLIPAIQSTNSGDWAFLALPDAANDVIATIASMEHGDYFLAVSEGDPSVATWPVGLYQAFHQIGIDTARLRNLQGTAFIALGRKGFPNQAILVDHPNVYDTQQSVWRYDLRVALNSTYDNGSVASTTIGPASDWNQLFWNWDAKELFGGDDVRVDLFASRNGSTDSLVYKDLERGSFQLNSVDADKYPYMRLKAWLKDTIGISAPQLDHWHVLYTPAPDAAIDPTVDWSFAPDTVMHGQAAAVKFTARNVSGFDMDSLLVRFAVRRADRSIVELGTRRYQPLLATQSYILNYDFNMPASGISGPVTFLVELNPYNDQVEQHHFNNIYEHKIYVIEDRIQPILDVTVDGKHLMNNDIVSPLPEILVEVNDENPFLAISDTAYEVYFGRKTPNPASLPRVFIDGNNQMETVPASMPSNKARLYFRPGRLDDGEYMLRVQAYDQSGNAAGKTAYEIVFQVINESTLSNVLNYPNPFSTSTRFVYTLTGSEIPEVFQVHIYTITGRLVKVVDLHETNDVRIGYTITDFAWDGRDEFGDLLANGVYIYRVVAKSQGSEMKHREEGVSQMFDNGYGKMYIMR